MDTMYHNGWAVISAIIFFIALFVHRFEDIEREQSGLAHPTQILIAGLLYFISTIALALYAGQNDYTMGLWLPLTADFLFAASRFNDLRKIVNSERARRLASRATSPTLKS